MSVFYAVKNMTEHSDIKYAQKLRSLRLMQNYKQEQVSEILGLSSQQEYSKLENGKINFTDDIIFRVCKAFSISPEEFMNGNLSTHILNSPNSFNHSQNNTINEKDFIDQLICAKNETIQAQKEQIELLKTQIIALQSKRG